MTAPPSSSAGKGFWSCRRERACAVQVEYKLDAKPSNVADAAYSQLSKHRLEAATKKTRQVRPGAARRGAAEVAQA